MISAIAVAAQARMLEITPTLRIPHDEFQWAFVRSSGPGGQNVNKVSSKAQLRWAIAASPSLPPAVRQRFLERFAARITTLGEILITSQRFRDQRRNEEDCLEKLREMLLSVARAPTPRKKTKPSRGSIERRREGKREQSEKKRSRRPPPAD